MPSYLAIDVGIDRLTAGLVDDLGEVLVRDRVATPPREVWPALHRLVRRVMAARPSDAETVVGCGVTTEAPIDVEAGITSPLHLPAWSSFPVRERLSELIALPVVLDTAAHGRVVAERWIGAAQTVDDVMVVLMSTAVEAGFITGGRLGHGRMGNAGALGHVLVEPEGLLCPCGAQGCLTPYVSAAALEEETSRPLRRAPASIVERAGVMLGRAISSTAAVLDLRLVLLTGFVPSVFGVPFLDAARREVDQRARLSFLRSGSDKAVSALDVDFTVLGSEAPLVGAAGIARMALAAPDGRTIEP